MVLNGLITGIGAGVGTNAITNAMNGEDTYTSPMASFQSPAIAVGERWQVDLTKEGSTGPYAPLNYINIVNNSDTDIEFWKGSGNETFRIASGTGVEFKRGQLDGIYGIDVNNVGTGNIEAGQVIILCQRQSNQVQA